MEKTRIETELQLTTEERVVPFSTYLRPSLQKRVKRLAVELETTVASLVEQALEEFLVARENQKN